MSTPRIRFSLLLATVDRTEEVHHFLRSLASQSCREFELIVIDQNSDGRLIPLLEAYGNEFPIRRVTSGRGHARAFNVGLMHARGEFVAFPDDDCWYDEDLLERVAALLDAHPRWDGLTGREIVEPGFRSGGRWSSRAGRITCENIWQRAISFSIFLRREATKGSFFDESLGVGANTPWGAGEETDYLLKLLRDGSLLFYDPSITIWHQGRSGPYTESTYAKAHRYGMGIGRVLRLNNYPAISVAPHLLRPLAGAFLTLACGQLEKARYHWSIFLGRARGWLSPAGSSHLEAASASPISLRRRVEELAQNSLVQNAAALYGVQFFRKVLPLITIPYLARILGPSGWGLVAFTQSLAELMVLTIEFGFNLSATREIARRRGSKESCGEIMAGVLGAQAILAALALLAALVIAGSIPLLREHPKLLGAGLFYAVAQGFMPLWFFQGLERMRLAAALEISGRTAGLIFLFCFVRSPEDTWTALFIQGLTPAVITAIGLGLAYRTIPCRFPTPQLVREAMARGWRMFVFRSGESLYGVLNAFILGLFATPVQVGYFASAEKISRAIFGLLNPIREALYPRLSSISPLSTERAARLARIGMALMIGGGALLGTAVFVFAPLLIQLLMGQGFGPAVVVLRILSVLPPLLAITHSAGLQWLLPLGRDKDINRVIVGAGAVNVALALILAPAFAHIGMASAVACAEAFACVSMWRIAARSMPAVQRSKGHTLQGACEADAA